LTSKSQEEKKELGEGWEGKGKESKKLTTLKKRRCQTN